MDKSADINDAAQLYVFVRDTDGNFDVTHRRTEIMKKIKEIMKNLNLMRDVLPGVHTERALVMIGNKSGVVSLLQARNGVKLNQYPATLHREAFCTNVIEYEHVIRVVTSVVNFERSQELKYRRYGV